MAIDSKTKQKLNKLFEGTDYRKVVSERAGVHPNTVTNVINNGTDNPGVELEILIYAQEIKSQKAEDEKKRQKSRALAQQL
jgi:intracellular sulfur oxidation DsrE/DsrF family protein